MTNGPRTIEERLRTALREAALQVQASPPPVTSLDRPARRRRPGLLVAIAAALAVVVVVAFGAALALVGRDHTPEVVTPSARQPRELSPSRLLPGEADITVFMKPALSYPEQQGPSQSEIDAVRRLIRRSGDVRSFAFVDRAATYREYQKNFRDQPDLVNTVDQNALPLSFRLVLRHCDAQAPLITRLGEQPGVDQAIAGRGLSHATAERLGYQRTVPPNLLNSHCGYHQPRGKPVATLTITALPTLSYQATEYTVPAGIIEIDLSSAGGTHTLVFDDPRFRGFELAVPQGPVRGKIELKPGTYVIYCSIPGHREAGEQATITASGK
jgi:FtsX extracellular domain